MRAFLRAGAGAGAGVGVGVCVRARLWGLCPLQDIVEAYAVLSDPELRRLYDQGHNVPEVLQRRAQGAAPEHPQWTPDVEVPEHVKRKGEAKVKVTTEGGEEYEVRMAFDGRPLAADHCCVEWHEDW